jgi:hypothetical protein
VAVMRMPVFPSLSVRGKPHPICSLRRYSNDYTLKTD